MYLTEALKVKIVNCLLTSMRFVMKYMTNIYNNIDRAHAYVEETFKE